MSSLVSRVILSPNSSTRTCITILPPSISSFRASDIAAVPSPPRTGPSSSVMSLRSWPDPFVSIVLFPLAWPERRPAPASGCDCDRLEQLVGLAPDPARDLLRIDTHIAGNCCDSHHNQSNFFVAYAPL